MYSSEHATESQETLINPTSYCLKFNRKSITNSTLYAGSGSLSPAYRIATNQDFSRTDIFDLTLPSDSEQRLATIKRRDFLPDVVKYRNRSSDNVVKINQWLKGEKLHDGQTGVSFDSSIGRLQWRHGDLEQHRLSLYNEKGVDRDQPIAYLEVPQERRVPMELVIEPGYQHLVEDILISCIILEYKLKIFDRLKKHDLSYGPILGSLISLR